jgi:aspartate kinase (monofunctional class)
VKRPLVIHKFGGTSLGSAERIEAAAAILKRATRRERVVAVVSATAGTTDALLAAAHEAQRGRASAWRAGLEAIAKRHLDLAAQCGGGGGSRGAREGHGERGARDGRGVTMRGGVTRGAGRGAHAGSEAAARTRRAIETALRELETMLSGIALLRELSPRSLDAVASFGERLSAPIAAAALTAHGVAAAAVDARAFIRTDDRHGRATADLAATKRATRKRIGPLLARGVVPVVTGFIGSGPSGETTTLGRSGSDTTAAILGAVLGARRIVIWTDVDGVHSADPRFVKGTRVLPRLTYREAAELTYFGAKVLHFPAMIPAIAAGVPIVIQNSFRPGAPGTTIDARGSGRATGISAVTSIRGLALVSLEGKGMVGVPGIAARAFSAVARERVSVLMFSQASSEQNICLVVPEEDRARSFKALREEFGAEIALGKLDGVKAHGPVAAVAAVGEGMRGTPGVAARLFSAVAAARINVEAIAQGSSEVNISFIVEDRDAAAAVAAVHRLCVTATVRRRTTRVTSPSARSTAARSTLKNRARQLPGRRA